VTVEHAGVSVRIKCQPILVWSDKLGRMIDTILAQTSGAVETARNAFAENSSLVIALGATGLVGWGMVKRVFKLALYAAIAGAAAWFWYFNIRA